MIPDGLVRSCPYTELVAKFNEGAILPVRRSCTKSLDIVTVEWELPTVMLPLITIELDGYKGFFDSYVDVDLVLSDGATVASSKRLPMGQHIVIADKRFEPCIWDATIFDDPYVTMDKNWTALVLEEARFATAFHSSFYSDTILEYDAVQRGVRVDMLHPSFLYPDGVSLLPVDNRTLVGQPAFMVFRMQKILKNNSLFSFGSDTYVVGLVCTLEGHIVHLCGDLQLETPIVEVAAFPGSPALPFDSSYPLVMGIQYEVDEDGFLVPVLLHPVDGLLYRAKHEKAKAKPFYPLIGDLWADPDVEESVPDTKRRLLVHEMRVLPNAWPTGLSDAAMQSMHAQLTAKWKSS